MSPKLVRLYRVPIYLSFIVIFAALPAFAQSAASLSGKVSGPTGNAVVGATVAAKNQSTGESTTAQTNASGIYRFSNLAAGDYQLTISAAAFDSKTETVTLAAAANQTLDISLTPTLTLEDLGITARETQGNPAEQARLNKRSHMLQIHQRLGLITVIPLAATVISGAFAGGKTTSSSSRDLHVALGATTAGLYFATAYYAIFAPKIPGTKSEGPIRWHKALAWIHGPGMILTPLLGEMAFAQRSKGERVHGIARYHGQVAIVTAAAYGLAILSVSLHSGPAAKSAHAFLSLFHRHQSVSANAEPPIDTAKTAEGAQR